MIEEDPLNSVTTHVSSTYELGMSLHYSLLHYKSVYIYQYHLSFVQASLTYEIIFRIVLLYMWESRREEANIMDWVIAVSEFELQWGKI